MSTEIANRFLRAGLSSNGTLTDIVNRGANEDYTISSDSFEVITNRGRFCSSDSSPVNTQSTPDRLCFDFNAGFCLIRLEYTFSAGNPWFKRRLRLSNIWQALALEKVVLGRTAFDDASQFINYDTFWYAPTVAFMRFRSGGIFTGIENPFFVATGNDREAVLAFEPGLILKPGEEYESEPQFIGVYRKSGVMVQDHNPRTSIGQRPRFRNPCGHVPIDRAEVRAMQEFAKDYLDVQTDRFTFILYNFFHPLPQMPQPNSPEEAVHLKMIDMFHELGGDLIIFNPMYPYTRPQGKMYAFWDLGPDGSAARKIMDHAAAMGLRFGYYMGCARHGSEGNACALPFAPERTEWKKIDDKGVVAGENCIACDDYADWFFAVQRNTIERFKLRLWSWDPGPGNGNFCHSDKHGHIPGKGAYKGWRSSTAMLRRIKEAFPGIYFQAFYGRKEYGLWGFKYFDQHESYWELGLMNCTMYPELHADRMNADGVRHQGWWNQTFRFHPSALTHGMVHRFQEGVHDPRLTKVWDHLGWKFSVMSGLAAAGSITTVILPEDFSIVPEMPEFYRKWLAWARKNYDYMKYNVPFGSQVRPGGVDGWARIKDTHGFIFLCNSGPRPARIEFGLDGEIGLEAGGRFALKEEYPAADRFRFDWTYERGVFAAGDRVSLVVPEHEVLLLELVEVTEATIPSVFDIPEGSITALNAMPVATGVHGKPGETISVAFLQNEKAFANGTINGVGITLRQCNGYAAGEISFAGRRLPRLLDDWRTPDGASFHFPRHEACGKIVLRTAFDAWPEIRELLAKTTPPNLADFEQLIPKWKAEYPLDNYAWSRPDRLWLIIPFTDADMAVLDGIRLDGKDVPLECHKCSRKLIYYVDLTDHVTWGNSHSLELEFSSLAENQFMGPYLDYPQEAFVSIAVEPVTPAKAAVVYDGPLDPEMKPRLHTSPVDTRRAPVVASALMSPEYLHAGDGVNFSVAVDMTPGELEGVYISGPWFDAQMTYDSTTGRWGWGMGSMDRGWIMDVESYFVWAVAKNGMISESLKIPLKWRF